MNRIGSTDIRKDSFRPVVLGLLFFCFGLGGCATQQDVSLLQRQIWDARRELDKTKAQFAELEKAMDEKLEADRQPLRRNQAAVGAQLDRIELEFGRLNGQLEEAAAMNERNGVRISEIQQRQMESMLEIRKTVEDLQRGQSLMASYFGLQELVVTSKTGSQKEKKADQAKSGGIEVKTASKPPSSDAEGLYEEAFQLFRGGKFEAARAEFSSYLERYPKTDLADNAQFWLGECYYSEKRYREAIAAYEKTIKDYPKGDKVSSALLKQGMAFLELGDKTAGKILLKKVVQGYPQSNQAKIARSKLARIK
ncbi:MAG: tol-pal system protein YbgF [Deltaproteobacteria bacterium]|nr:MAG: tol-pal system protein YbgF [Deltaproteobacteria bacterium]